MSLTYKQALALKPGTILVFEGTPDHEFEFKKMDWFGGREELRMSLVRDDGYKTFATQHNLKKMSIQSSKKSEDEPWAIESLPTMTKKELIEIAKGLDVEFKSSATNETLVELIKKTIEERELNPGK